MANWVGIASGVSFPERGKEYTPLARFVLNLLSAFVRGYEAGSKVSAELHGNPLPTLQPGAGAGNPPAGTPIPENTGTSGTQVNLEQ